MTQLMKFGSVVRICTLFLYAPALISERKMAKTTGSTEVSMFKPLMANVLRKTWRIILTRTGLENNVVNIWNPTKGVWQQLERRFPVKKSIRSNRKADNKKERPSIG